MTETINKNNNLEQGQTHTQEYDFIAFHTIHLSMLEIGLGGLLHGLRIPFTGQFLSLNQIFILTIMNIQNHHKTYPATASTCCALLKSLAPAGKKLTPMLAISAQGHLYSGALYLLGSNFWGRCLGSFFAGLWSFIQPLLLYLIIFGKELIDVYEYFIQKFSVVFSIEQSTFYGILIGIILVKVLLSLTICSLAHRVSAKQIENYYKWVFKFKKHHINKKGLTPLKGAIKDTLNPFFIFTFILTCLFFVFANSDFSLSIWILLRPMAIGFILFYLLRKFPVKNSVESMKGGLYKEILLKALKHFR